MIDVSNNSDITDMVHRPDCGAGKMAVARVIVKWVEQRGHKAKRKPADVVAQHIRRLRQIRVLNTLLAQALAGNG